MELEIAKEETKTNPNGDKETLIEYKPVDVRIQRRNDREVNMKNGKKGTSVGLIFDDVPSRVLPDGNTRDFCGINPAMVERLGKILDQCKEGSMVRVTLYDDSSYRNIARIEPLDLGGETVTSNNSTVETQTTTPRKAINSLNRVPPAWELGIDYNNRKDNKICLNVATNNAVTMFGHMAELVGKIQPQENDHPLSKQFDETYNLALGLIDKLSTLPIVDEMEDEEEVE